MLKLVKYIKRYWWALAINTVVLVVQAVLQLALPTYMSKILSSMQTVPDFTLRMADVWKFGGIMIGICFGIFICAQIVQFLNSKVGSIYARNIREAVYSKVMSFSMNEFDKFGTASLLTRTTNDINILKDTFTMFCRNVIYSPVILGVAIIMSAIKSWQLSIVFLVALPILLITIIVVFIFASPLFIKIQKRLDNLTIVLREGLTGVRVIRAFNQQDEEYVKFSEKNRDMTAITVKVNRTMAAVMPVINVIFNMTYVSVFIAGFIMLDKQMITAETSQIFINTIEISNYSTHIMSAFLMMGMVFIQMPNANACSKRVFEILNMEPSIVDPENPIDVNTIKEEDKCSVEFKNVTFTFPDASEPTLTDINFKVKPGQTTAIIGSTGSGKSSIINLIPRFYDTTVGKVKVDGVSVKDYSQKDLRNKIGFVPQQARLFSGTIKDNLLYGNPNATDEELIEALKVAQAYKFVSKKEGGINSKVSQGGKNFSGGQKQRLAIARALVKKPEIYVFDDSFSALDFKTDIKLRTALKKYVGNSAVIVVAQRVSSIIDADNIIVLNDGQIVGQGTHDELLMNCPVYQQIVMSQLDKDEIAKTMEMKKKLLESPTDDDEESEGGEQ